MIFAAKENKKQQRHTKSISQRTTASTKTFAVIWGYPAGCLGEARKRSVKRGSEARERSVKRGNEARTRCVKRGRDL